MDGAVEVYRSVGYIDSYYRGFFCYDEIRSFKPKLIILLLIIKIIESK